MNIFRALEKKYLAIFNRTNSLPILLLFALVPTLVIILLIANLNSKYLLEQKKARDYEDTQILAYYPQGALSEMLTRVDILNFNGVAACCQLYLQSSTVTDQINFYGSLPQQANLNAPIFCDVNKDGYDDLFVFTQQEDSIFINAVDLVTKELLLYGRFLSTVGMGQTNSPDFVLRPVTTFDNNGDGVPELYFIINAGFVLTPRQIFAYNYVDDTLMASANIGGQHFVTPQHLSSDSLSLVSCTLATNNYGDAADCLYSDTCTWLLYYDKMLTISKVVHSFPGTSNRIFGPYEVDGHHYFYVFNSGVDERSDFIVEIDDEENVIKKKLPFGFDKIAISRVVFRGKDHYLLSGRELEQAKLLELDFKKAELTSSKFTRSLPQSEMIPCEVRGERAYLSSDPVTGDALLLLDDFSQQLSFGRPLTLRSYNLYFQTFTTKDNTIIQVTDQEDIYTYVLSRNKRYSQRYIWWFIIYILSFVFVKGLESFFIKRLNKRTALNDEIKSLQIQLVNAQLDPHLTYNVLNLVSSKVLKGDRLEAYDLITRFSELMRSALLFSSDAAWTISEELAFIEHYKVIMQTRFVDKFELEVKNEIGEHLSDIMIPRLLLQNAVENSIKHAFVDMKEKGMILISLKVVDAAILISITDNGLGITKSQANPNPKGTGKGVAINKHQVELFNKLYKTHLSYTVAQRSDEPGTCVSITVPILT